MPIEPKRTGDNISIWEDTASFSDLHPLKSDEATDVCIIGAGIAGMTTAYLLTEAGRAVIVIDERGLGAGMTARTTAHLVNALDDRYYDIEKYHGEEGARLAAESHSAAIDQIEKIVSDAAIDCDFLRLDGYLFLPPGDDIKYLEEEFEACRRAGLNVERVDAAPIDSFKTGAAIRFPKQAQFHPLKYLRGLERAITKKGGRIFTGNRVVDVQESEEGFAKTQEGHRIRAQSFVVATNSPINDRYAIHTKQAPYTTYVVGFEFDAGAIPRILLWDTAETAEQEGKGGVVPYHYVRVAPSGRDDGKEILIVGGSDHKTGQAADFDARFEYLERWTRERFPKADAVRYRWSGQVLEPVDSMAFIGRNPMDKDNVYIVTGDSGNGMTHGTIAGILITDLITGRENPWTKLYDPSRKSIRALSDFARENVNVAMRYGDYITPGDMGSVDEIQRGDGGLVRDGLRKIAAYRDDNGALHKMSAICPHLKCIVQWNATEKTWDCPCHGSRFDCRGKVLQGPSIADLSPVE